MSIATCTMATPLGDFTVLAGEEAVHAAGFAGSADELRAHLGSNPIRSAPARRAALPEIRNQVAAYFDGNLAAFDGVAVVQPGGPLFLRAWSRLRETEPGERMTYRQLAQLSGSPAAIRAAASACARNAVCLIIPCHRVIRSDGTLGGYGYGLERKRALLDHEDGEYLR